MGCASSSTPSADKCPPSVVCSFVQCSSAQVHSQPPSKFCKVCKAFSWRLSCLPIPCITHLAGVTSLSGKG